MTTPVIDQRKISGIISDLRANCTITSLSIWKPEEFWWGAQLCNHAFWLRNIPYFHKMAGHMGLKSYQNSILGRGVYFMLKLDYIKAMLYQNLLHLVVVGLAVIFLQFFEEKERFLELHHLSIDLVAVGCHACLASARNVLKIICALLGSTPNNSSARKSSNYTLPKISFKLD